MKLLRMKLTPRSGCSLEVTWYSCPDTKGDPKKTLALVQREADKRGLNIDYSLATEQDYVAQRAARLWMFTEPGDEAADKTLKLALVRAGLFEDTGDIVRIATDDDGKDHVMVFTGTTVTIIDTQAGVINTAPASIPVPA